MEVSPRGGGNRLSEMMRFISNQDLIDNCVRAAVGDPIDNIFQPKYNGFWAEIILHSEHDGIFHSIDIESSIEKKNLIEKDLWIEQGDKVQGFSGANTTIGTLVLRFNMFGEMQECLKNQETWLSINVL